MKNNLNGLLSKYIIVPSKITIRNNTKIFDDKVVIKKSYRKNIMDIYNYLKSRGFDYFIYPIEANDGYEVYPYIENRIEPLEQKNLDIMHIVSLLHNKTTFYKEIDMDKIKSLYEKVIDKINYLDNYYNNIIDNIEKEIYMSPSSYLLARNINIIFDSIYYVKNNIDKWYNLVKDNKNKRVVYIHGNINLEHFINGDKPYLISWNNSRIDSPIFDLLNYYKNNYENMDFEDLLKYYESKYPLKNDERILLFSLMAIPWLIEFNNDQYKMCIKINRMIEYLYKTRSIILNYQK